MAPSVCSSSTDNIKQRMVCPLCEKVERKNLFANYGCIIFQQLTLSKHANNAHQITLKDIHFRKCFESCVEKNAPRTDHIFNERLL